MSSLIKEAINLAEITKIFLERNWMVYRPEADIGGIDFLIMNLDSNEIRKIQLKSRWTIDIDRYATRDLWICFPEKGNWYLCKHDQMVGFGDECNYNIWNKKDNNKAYSRQPMCAKMTELMSNFIFK